MADTETSDSPNLMGKSPKIIIIGAGIAGLAAGEYLAKAGITDFKILEATDRTGGRIWSIDVDVTTEKKCAKAELGANFIHGIERNPIFKIADTHGLIQLREAKSLKSKTVYRTEEGEEVSKKICESVDMCYGLLMAQCEDFYQLHIPTPMENDSVGEFLEREFSYEMEKYEGEDHRLRQLVFNQRLSGEAVVSGCHSMREVSLSEIGSYEELPGIHYTIPQGFESVIDILKRSIPPESILTNHEVKCIHWQRDTKDTSEGGPVLVECADGQKLYADHVIVTVSLGVLKEVGKRMFSPELPELKSESIERLEYGVVDKMILEFEGPVFDTEVSKVECLWDRDNADLDDIPSNWTKKIYCFDVIHENVLLGWLSGKEAKYSETLSDEEIGATCVKVLENFLKRKDLPKIKRVMRSKWHSNPFTRGSYTFIPVGATVDDIENLAEPLPLDSPKPEILFAGEATHHSFYSSTHGALLTGQREAQRILDIYAPPEDDH